MLIVVRNDSGAGTPARKTTKVLEFWWFHGPRCWNVMTPFAHGIKWSTEDSIDVMDAWVCLGGVRPAAGSENFSIFSFACLCRITRRWTFFTTPCRSCSRSLLSWVGHDTLQKEMDIELDPRRANCIKWSQIYIYVQQTSGLFPSRIVDCTQVLRTLACKPPSLRGCLAAILGWNGSMNEPPCRLILICQNY